MNHDDVQHLPGLNEEYELTSVQTDSYQKNGHIMLRGVASPFTKIKFIGLSTYRIPLRFGV